ncbi:hypothetical protein AAZX31_20G228400 [Glycine max]|uniref:Uncharacterized protein n=2 Tax=Glycine subgen. Soja TaxID=1462606 RepID=K7N5E4_SOYBN|nr:uncharacterized protein LOC102668095 [Glycine max]XP_028220818.1 uncharacterized protein LOC114402450 [Glycine soja]XP_040869422.1 uncharacterized protein LOC102668095 [Glycine max]KAG4395572.1 hypothetical protein GLYMA_20G243300v4 [Glycine max]KAG4908688.1 hypothetical protein JHK86_057172 [Glycine max]KAG4911332.1 hypothetical protein JHK87_057448 [Glycine soja]KAG4919918.1 hypothetical protein JHK85_058199 [Glycine max]KAG5076000.1 hypothetical protein JHK84_057231 [Glycine max]|eukprot:XP_006606570.1 uncharacterized protein LOC102668095 [Glycine max]
MSQQQNQNLPAVSQSLLQQTVSGADVKPFSIRQYVIASRHINILHNWPFHEKHLQLCLNHGLKEVLPPFGRQTSPAESLQGCSNLMQSLDDNDNKEADFCKAEVPHLIDDDHPQSTNNECVYKVTNHTSAHEEASHSNQLNCSISDNLSQPAANTCTLPSSTHASKSLPSSKAVKDKRKRRKWRCKKRSMVDILAVARHTTLEEIHRMNKFYYAETVIKGCQQTVPHENISRSEVVGLDSCRKAGSEDHGVANVDMTPKGPLLLKFKLNGCNVNRNFKLSIN